MTLLSHTCLQLQSCHRALLIFPGVLSWTLKELHGSSSLCALSVAGRVVSPVLTALELLASLEHHYFLVATRPVLPPFFI